MPSISCHLRWPSVVVISAYLVFLSLGAAADLPFAVIQLSPFLVEGKPTRAHTQGLEIVASDVYVTARQEDVLPKRALLARTNPARSQWDVWDITPLNADGSVTSLDHPGGFQSDGDHLWIPLAESKRNGRSIIRKYALAKALVGRPLKPEFEFPVTDHIGALAVFADREVLLGAAWDSASVYVWDFGGRLQKTISGTDLAHREIGVRDRNASAGLTVQDWKAAGNRLFASGLFRNSAASGHSRLIAFEGFLEPQFKRVSIALPKQEQVELAHEGMAISDGNVYFLPEDLGATNRMFRVSLNDLGRLGRGDR